MIKYFRSERGSTLMMVFGFILVMALLIAPLAANANIGLLQVKKSGNYETAFNKAQSAMTIFDHMYKELESNEAYPYTKQDIVNLVGQIDSMKAELDLREIKLIEVNGVPRSVVFYAEDGEGNQNRSSKLTYRLQQLPIIVATPPPTPTPDIPAATATPLPTPTPAATPKPQPTINPSSTRVIQNKVINDNLFCLCTSPNSDDKSFINHSYNKSSFQAEFGYYIDYYLQDKFTQQTQYKLIASVPSTALDSTIPFPVVPAASSSGTKEIVNSGAGIVGYGGSVKITHDNQDVVNISSVSEGKAIEAAGNLTIADDNWRPAMNIQGDVIVGGNLSTNANSYLTFGGNVYVAGNLNLGNIKEAVFTGDLIVLGNLTTNNSIEVLKVQGKLIVKGDVLFGNVVSHFMVGSDMTIHGNYKSTNTIQSFEVRGKLTVAGNMNFSGTVEGLIFIHADMTVYKDFESQTIKSLEVNGKLTVVGNMKLSGTVNEYVIVRSDMTIMKDFVVNTIKKIDINGIFKINGSAYFANSVQELFNVNSDFIALGKIHFTNTVQKLNIGGNMITGQSLIFAQPVTESSIRGSLLVTGDSDFRNTTEKLIIAGDFISKGFIHFNNVISNLSVSGSIVSGAEFTNSSGIRLLAVGKDLLVKTNFTIANITNDGFKMNGYFMVYGDAVFGDVPTNKVVSMKGFMVGGDTSFAEYVKWSQYNNTICMS